MTGMSAGGGDGRGDGAGDVGGIGLKAEGLDT